MESVQTRWMLRWVLTWACSVVSLLVSRRARWRPSTFAGSESVSNCCLSVVSCLVRLKSNSGSLYILYCGIRACIRAVLNIQFKFIFMYSCSNTNLNNSDSNNVKLWHYSTVTGDWQLQNTLQPFTVIFLKFRVTILVLVRITITVTKWQCWVVTCYK